MIIKKGNLFDSRDDVLLVTTNSFIKKDGSLVMGRGAASDLSKMMPNISKLAGERIKLICGHLGKYGVELFSIATNPFNLRLVGLFQVKTAFYLQADPELIRFSTEKLLKLLETLDEHGYKNVSMNFPGIGNGQLSAKTVLPIIEQLPDNVSIYVKDWMDLYG